MTPAKALGAGKGSLRAVNKMPTTSPVSSERTTTFIMLLAIQRAGHEVECQVSFFIGLLSSWGDENLLLREISFTSAPTD